jgi:dihydrofolate synthase/folylpolyglutamate synthase
MQYEDALEYLSSLTKFGMNFGLLRIERLMELMEYPHQCFKSIHITGSNGKGSTSAMLASILHASGLKTGLYTSPHLKEYTERMETGGVQISREEFAEAIFHTKKFVDQMLAEGFEQPTEFEVITAAAFYYFAVSGAEYVVVEAGLGGLLDSTNVIMPEIAVITNVVLEHTDRCGNTVGEIAVHKAGIIKKNIPVITAARGDALEIIREKAKETESEILIFKEDFDSVFRGASVMRGGRQNIDIETKKMGSISVELNLLGFNQLENCSLATAAALKLAAKENNISHETIRQGLKCVTWPGRFELAGVRPLIIIDGAHNPAGAKSLRENLDQYFPGAKITFVLGILRDKDIKGIAGALIRPEDSTIIIKSAYHRAASPDEISREISEFGSLVEKAASIEKGIERAKELAGPDGIVSIAGSLYQIGDVRDIVYKKGWKDWKD